MVQMVLLVNLENYNHKTEANLYNFRGNTCSGELYQANFLDNWKISATGHEYR